jgi:outer membrane protein assembly factor BamD (BamD/ComL family)
MKIAPRIALLGAVCTAALLFLGSCASGPVVIPTDLSAAEIFQRAQDASDRGDYTLAIRYYDTVPTSYPDDVNHVTWASYEIAFLYHKMGKHAQALTLINQLLDKYDKEGNTLPPAPRVLASKLKVRLQDTLQTKQ